MKKDIIFTSVLLLAGILLFLFDVTGAAAHIIVSVIGIMALAAYSAVTR